MTGAQYADVVRLAYCGTSARSLVHLADIEKSRYDHLNVFLTGCIGDAEVPSVRYNEGNGFVGGLVNTDMVWNPDNVPPVQELNERFVAGFGNGNAHLERFLTASYDDEQTRRAERDHLVQPLNASQFVFICQVLLNNPNFNRYMPMRRRSTALVGPPGTGKTKTIMSLIAATYCCVDDGGQSAILTEIRRRQWANAVQTRHRVRETVQPLIQGFKQADIPKILLVAPTNRAVDVLEERLQEGIPVWDLNLNAWTHVIPIYRRLGNEEINRNERLTRRRNELIPNDCRALLGGITLCTLGSVYRAFPFRRDARAWRSMVPYQYVIVDEVSQISDSELFILMNSLACSSNPYETAWPRMCNVGDPYQLHPTAICNRPPCYAYTKQLSFLERMIPECSPYLRGQNKIPAVHLNVQYRMLPAIGELANLITGRLVRTRIMPPNRDQLTRIEDETARPPFIYNGILADITIADLLNHIVWVDPYVDAANVNSRSVDDIVQRANAPWVEFSPVEMVAVHAVLRSYHLTFGGDRVLNNMRILSPYQRQCEMIRHLLNYRFFGTQPPEDQRTNNSVGTVTSCQGMEADLVIFSAGRGPLDPRPLGQDNLLDKLRDLYVMTSRARCNLVIIASMDYMYDNCPSWHRVIDHFRGLQNNLG